MSSQNVCIPGSLVVPSVSCCWNGKWCRPSRCLSRDGPRTVSLFGSRWVSLIVPLSLCLLSCLSYHALAVSSLGPEGGCNSGSYGIAAAPPPSTRGAVINQVDVGVGEVVERLRGTAAMTFLAQARRRRGFITRSHCLGYCLRWSWRRRHLEESCLTCAIEQNGTNKNSRTRTVEQEDQTRTIKQEQSKQSKAPMSAPVEGPRLNTRADSASRSVDALFHLFVTITTTTEANGK